MKFAVVVLALVVVAVSANPQWGRFDSKQKYNPYWNQKKVNSPFGSIYSSGNYFPQPAIKVTNVKPAVITPAPIVPVVVPVPERVVVETVPGTNIKVSSDDSHAQVVKYVNEANDDGSTYFFETNNGIAVQAKVSPRNYGGNPPVISDVIEGSFSWISPEGKVITTNYVADENGYRPTGNALPQAPEVPAQIARALAYAAKYSAGVRTNN